MFFRGYLPFARLVRGHRAVGEDEADGAAGGEMVQEVLHPGEVRIAHRWSAVDPALVVPQPLATPVRDVEGRVGEDVVGAEVGMAVVVKAVPVLDLALDAPDRQVHPGHSPSGVVRLLPVDRDVTGDRAAVAVAGSVGADELYRLDEHAGGAAARVVDPAPVRLQHLHQQPHHGAGRVELAALPALLQGERFCQIGGRAGVASSSR